jgi:hypothetical protein
MKQALPTRIKSVASDNLPLCLAPFSDSVKDCKHAQLPASWRVLSPLPPNQTGESYAQKSLPSSSCGPLANFNNFHPRNTGVRTQASCVSPRRQFNSEISNLRGVCESNFSSRKESSCLGADSKLAQRSLTEDSGVFISCEEGEGSPRKDYARCKVPLFGRDRALAMPEFWESSLTVSPTSLLMTGQGQVAAKSAEYSGWNKFRHWLEHLLLTGCFSLADRRPLPSFKRTAGYFYLEAQ